ncbi:transposase [Azospirillum sp.]|uniref:transposase n=1 Tax=Azospirillum sp. TaxID=34012 RepID=UPI0034277884
MGEKRSVEFKVSLVRPLEAGERVTDLERESGVFRSQIYRWRASFARDGEAGGSSSRRAVGGCFGSAWAGGARLGVGA